MSRPPALISGLRLQVNNKSSNNKKAQAGPDERKWSVFVLVLYHAPHAHPCGSFPCLGREVRVGPQMIEFSTPDRCANCVSRRLNFNSCLVSPSENFLLISRPQLRSVTVQDKDFETTVFSSAAASAGAVLGFAAAACLGIKFKGSFARVAPAAAVSSIVGAGACAITFKKRIKFELSQVWRAPLHSCVRTQQY